MKLVNGGTSQQLSDGKNVLELGTELTIGVWLRADWDDRHCDTLDELDVSNSPAGMTIYDNGTATTTRLRVGVLCDRQTITVRSGKKADKVRLPVGLDDGQPHHLLLRFDDDGVHVMVDGAGDTMLPVTPTPAGPVPVTVGNDATGKSPFIGLIGGLVVLDGTHAPESMTSVAPVPVEEWTDLDLVSSVILRMNGTPDAGQLALAGLSPLGRWVGSAHRHEPQEEIQSKVEGIVEYAPRLTHTVLWTDGCSELAKRADGYDARDCGVPVLAMLVSALWGDTEVRLFQRVGADAYERIGGPGGFQLERDANGGTRLVTDAGVILTRPRPEKQQLPFSDTMGGAGGEANYEWLNYAFDLTRLDPRFPSRSPRGAPVFGMLPRMVGHNYTQVGKIVVPYGVRLGNQQAACYGESFAREMTTSEEVVEELSKLYSTESQRTESDSKEAAYGVYNFHRSDFEATNWSKNSGLEEKLSKLRGKETSEFRQQIRCVDYEFFLAPAEAELHDSFQRRVETLRKAQKSSRAGLADALVRDVGTHYANSITYGALASLEVEMSGTSAALVDELARRSGSSNGDSVGWDMGGGVSISGNIKGVNFNHKAQLEKSKAESNRRVSESTVSLVERELKSEKVTSTNWTTVGGTGAGTHEGWTSQGVLVPIHMQLRPISELLSPPYFTDPDVIFSVRRDVELAIERRLGSARAAPMTLAVHEWDYEDWGDSCPHLDLSCDWSKGHRCRDAKGGQKLGAEADPQFCLLELGSVEENSQCRDTSECTIGLACVDQICSQSDGGEPTSSRAHWTATFGLERLPVDDGGRYLLKQKLSGRYMQGSGEVTTEDMPATAAQAWQFRLAGLLVRLKRGDSSFLDAYDDADGRNYDAVTRDWQRDTTQNWLLVPNGDGFRIRHAVNGRYLDAHETADQDYRAVTRERQENRSQIWLLKQAGTRITLKQGSSNRLLSPNKSDVVTSGGSATASKEWTVVVVGPAYVIEGTKGQALDADQTDYDVLMATKDDSASQLWHVAVSERHSKERAPALNIVAVSNGRYIDAFDEDGYEVVTRESQEDSSQAWIFDQR